MLTTRAIPIGLHCQRAGDYAIKMALSGRVTEGRSFVT